MITVAQRGYASAGIASIGGPPLLERLEAKGRLSPAESKERAVPLPLGARVGVMDIMIERRR